MDPKGTNNAQTADLDRVTAERRTHPRYLEEVRVRYRDLEGWARGAWGRSRDLSLGGMCLLAKVEVGSHLALEIHIDDEPAPVLALGRVLRCEEDGDGHSAGIQFLWISEEDRANLYRLADHFRAKYGEF